MRSEAETQYRKNILTHLKYIKEQVDVNQRHLEKINGRLRQTEASIAWMKGIGVTITFVLSFIIGYFKINK